MRASRGLVSCVTRRAHSICHILTRYHLPLSVSCLLTSPPPSRRGAGQLQVERVRRSASAAGVRPRPGCAHRLGGLGPPERARRCAAVAVRAERRHHVRRAARARQAARRRRRVGRARLVAVRGRRVGPRARAVPGPPRVRRAGGARAAARPVPYRVEVPRARVHLRRRYVFFAVLSLDSIGLIHIARAHVLLLPLRLCP